MGLMSDELARRPKTALWYSPPRIAAATLMAVVTASMSPQTAAAGSSRPQHAKTTSGPIVSKDKSTARPGRDRASHDRHVASTRERSVSNRRPDSSQAPGWMLNLIVPESVSVGLDPSLLLAVAWQESAFDPLASAGYGSTAQGVFQFNDDAWLDAIRIYGPNHNLSGYADIVRAGTGGTKSLSPLARRRVLALRKDVRISAAMAAETMLSEQEELERQLGRYARPADFYFLHLLGPTGCQRFLTAVARTSSVSSSEFLGHVARTNPIIFYADGKPLTIAAAYANVSTTMRQRMEMYGEQIRHHHIAFTVRGEQRSARR